jgi:uncharacterized alkaline shock family protein YloU
MSTDWQAERLPCGRLLGDIVERVADGRGTELDAHQRTCRYCQAAMEDTERLWGGVRGYAEETDKVPPAVVDSLVRRVRNLVRLGWITLARGTQGVTRASGWIVAAIAELAADATPGVSRVGSSVGRVAESLRSALSRGAGERSVLGGRAFEVDSQQAAVDLDVTPRYGEPVHEVAEAVRQNVRTAVHDLTGLEVVEVNVRITDLDEG